MQCTCAQRIVYNWLVSKYIVIPNKFLLLLLLLAVSSVCQLKMVIRKNKSIQLVDILEIFQSFLSEIDVFSVGKKLLVAFTVANLFFT